MGGRRRPRLRQSDVDATALGRAVVGVARGDVLVLRRHARPVGGLPRSDGDTPHRARAEVRPCSTRAWPTSRSPPAGDLGEDGGEARPAILRKATSGSRTELLVRVGLIACSRLPPWDVPPTPGAGIPPFNPSGGRPRVRPSGLAVGVGLIVEGEPLWPSTLFRTSSKPAFEQRYGVPAINIVNDLTLESVLAGGGRGTLPDDHPDLGQDGPVGRRGRVMAMWHAMTAGIEVPVALHLDHCPDRAVITECLAKGWNSVLFDASHAAGRGEPAPDHRGGRRGPPPAPTSRARSSRSPASRTASAPTRSPNGRPSRSRSTSSSAPGSTCSRRRSATRTASTRRPELDGQRVTDIVAARPVPIALHGGSGLTRRAVPRPDRARAAPRSTSPPR